MLTSHFGTVAPAREVDYDRMSCLMGIPRDPPPSRWPTLGPRERFANWLLIGIEFEWAHAIDPPAAQGACSEYDARPIDMDVAKTGIAFMRALDQRDTLLDRKMSSIVGKYLQGIGAFPRRRPGRPRRRNRFADFLGDLLSVTWVMGGHVSFSRKTGKGNVAEALGELRQFMPPGFIPKALPRALIERSCTQARVFARDIASELGTQVTLETLQGYVYEEGKKAAAEARAAREQSLSEHPQ